MSNESLTEKALMIALVDCQKGLLIVMARINTLKPKSHFQNTYKYEGIIIDFIYFGKGLSLHKRV